MNPIFSYVNPILLFKKIPPYQYHFFILYKPANSDFRDSFRQNMGRYHVDSGKNIGLFVFDFPNDRWFRNNFQYFLRRYQHSSLHADWSAVMTEITRSTKDRLLWLKELKEGDYCSGICMDKFMKLFNIDDNDLPALVIFIKSQPADYYSQSNVNIGDIDNLLNSLTSQDKYKFHDSNLHRFPENMIFSRVIEILNDNFNSEYWGIAQAIHCLQAQKEEGREHLKGLIKTFPAFNDLKYPDYFEWHKDLIKWLRRYNNLVEKFVDQLNILIETPENNGLGLEKIKNFWRFRVNGKYRSHYFERHGKKVCYFLGYHDYQLR